MKAVQMFNNHKIGSQNLKVKFAKQVHGDGGGGGGGDFSKSRNSIIADEEFDWDEKKNSTNTSNGSKHRLDSESVFSQASSGGNTTKMVKKSMGRGQIINLIQEKRNLKKKFYHLNIFINFQLRRSRPEQTLCSAFN